MKKEIDRYFYFSPLGLIELRGTEEGISGLSFVSEKNYLNEIPKTTNAGMPAPLISCIRELDQYFAGEIKSFSVNVIMEGTSFQKKVWKKLMEIPFGKTVSYGEVARASGNERAARACGNACRKNKIAIIVPCHRVIGSNRKLTGYAGGLWRKRWLIHHETYSLKEGFQTGDKNQKYFWVYMIWVEGGKIYTGYTSNLVKRYAQHLKGKGGARFTRSFSPVKVAQCWKVFGSRGTALKIENYIKQQDRKTKELLVEKPWGLAEELRKHKELKVTLLPFSPLAIQIYLNKNRDKKLWEIKDDPFKKWPHLNTI